MRIINAQKESYHNALIKDFSETSRFISSGSVKGFVGERYSWFADFSNKFKENVSFNPHIAYVSFFSDKDIFVSEYSRVSQLTTQYPVVLTINDIILSEHFHELSTKQYSKIAQKHSAFDSIEFINESALLSYEGSDNIGEISRYHSYYYAPVVYEMGYKIDKGSLGSLPAQAGYDMYIWANRTLSPMTIRDYGFNIAAREAGDDVSGLSDQYLNDASISSRLVDYKILPIEIGWSFIDAATDHVYYPYDLKPEEPWSNRPYIGFPLLYNKVVGNDSELTESTDTSLYLSSFPQISYKNVIERQKIAISSSNAITGRAFFHSYGLSEEQDDQSQIIYHICRNYLYDVSFMDYRIGQKTPDNTVIVGVDINTERNRRYSAVVTTEPYMVTKPVGNGEVVDYKLVKDTGEDLEAGDFPAYRLLCLKIKAPRPFIRNLDRELEKNELNTDIIHTLHIQSPESDVTTVPVTNDYNRFSAAFFFERQEFALDDLVGGVVGIGEYHTFFVDFPDLVSYGVYSKISPYVSTRLARVCGAGYYVKTGSNAGTYLKLYCTNYTAESPVANQATTIVYNNFDHLEQNETFRPMLKLPGMRGYVKIISRSSAHRPIILSDGCEEVVYDIEFPYCPGSYNERCNYASEYKKTQIFYKSSYINSGHRSIDANDHYDVYNARYVPSGDSSFSRIDLYKSMDFVGDAVESDPESLGGNINDLVSNPSKRLQYPAYLAFRKTTMSLLFLTKPQDIAYPQYGTFEARLNPLTSDMKLVWCVDNRVWKFGENKFSSYINRECPSYVFELDTSALVNEFGREQYKYAGIPDIKRWIYSKAAAFCSTMNGNGDVPTQDSLSDIIIEIWNGTRWRPVTTSIYNSLKSYTTVLVDGLYCSGDAVLVFGDLYKVVLGKYDPTTFDYGLTAEEVAIINEKSNLVLFDSESMKTYHVAYVVQDTGDSTNVKVVAYIVMDELVELPQDESLVDPYGWVGPLSVCLPYSKLGKNTNFGFNSCEVVDSVLKTMYLDFGNKSNGDFVKYVHDNKMYIRIRPVKAKVFPASYEPDEQDVMQWLGSLVTETVVDEKTNFPWYNQFTSSYDVGFDWSKISIIEQIGKFGLNYFSLQSK